ncbi:acyl carrier protein [Amycolatopsis plumensis]|uniref:Acyl carrier protein n=1 Tax=Amycolatopsis plumensis TaxID=236508 RepID=A0ABV5UHY0_9PSEU
MTLEEVFAEVFGEPAESFTDESDRETVLGWTSMRHVTLLVQIENAFGVRFSNPEMATMRSLGDIRAALADKEATVS